MCVCVCVCVCPPPPPAVLQVLAIHVNRWKLDFKLGVYVMVLYVIFLCFSILIEYNVFTFVNLPMCTDDQ